MLEDLVFDEQYQPDEKVLESANILSGTAYDIPNCVDRLLSSRVISVKKILNHNQPIRGEDIALLVEYEGWSIHKPFWFDPSDSDHSIDSIWDYQCKALFLRSELIKDEIDDQFGWAPWIDIDVDVFTIKTTEAPEDVINAYCEEIKRDWQEFADQWLDCGMPDYSSVNPKIKTALDKAITKYNKSNTRK